MVGQKGKGHEKNGQGDAANKVQEKSINNVVSSTIHIKLYLFLV